MKNYKIVIASAGAALFLGLYALLLISAGRLGECAEGALFLLDAPATKAQAEQMQKREAERDEPAAFALWEQKSGVTARNERLQRRHTAALILFQGLPELVLPGNRLDAEDANGCLIDGNTALVLFGSMRVEGLSVTVDGRSKIVRGILQGAEDTILCRAEEGDALFHLCVRPKGGGAQEKSVQEFALRHGLSGRAVRVDLLCGVAGLLCILLPISACLTLLLPGVRAAWRSRRTLSGRFWLAAYAAAFLVLACWAAGRARLPYCPAPTKWSDFAFWKNWWAQARADALLLLLIEKQKPMQIWAEEFSRVCAYGAFSFFLLLFPGRY